MPSDSETTNLAWLLAELKDEFRSGLSTLKRELSEEYNTAVKKLKCTFNPKGWYACVLLGITGAGGFKD